jgi:hypothetical protein
MRKRTIASLTAVIEDLRHQLYAERGRHLLEVKTLQDDITYTRIALEEIIQNLREEILEIKTRLFQACREFCQKPVGRDAD